MHVSIGNCSLDLRSRQADLDDIELRNVKPTDRAVIRSEERGDTRSLKMVTHKAEAWFIVAEDINGKPERPCVLGPNLPDYACQLSHLVRSP